MSLIRGRAIATFGHIRCGVSRPLTRTFVATPNHLATSDLPSTSSSAFPSPQDAGADGQFASGESVESQDGLSAGAPRRIRKSYPIPRNIALPPASDPLLSYFTSLMLKDGKRHQAARQVAETLNNIHIITRSPPLPILREAVERASPEVKVVSQKQRNKNVMTPRPLSSKQRTGQAIRWIIATSDKRQDHKVEQRLAKEIVAIINNSSDVLKKKDEVHKLALANRANASVRL